MLNPFKCFLGMAPSIAALGVFKAIKLCEMAAKVRRNREELVLVRREASQFLEYMRVKKGTVLEKLQKVKDLLQSLEVTDMQCSFEHSGGITTYAVHERDGNRNRLYLRGVHAVLSRSIEYYNCLIAKGRRYFGPISSAVDAARLNVVRETVDVEAFLEMEEETVSELDDNLLFSATE